MGGLSPLNSNLGNPWEFHRIVEVNTWGGSPWLEHFRDQIIYTSILIAGLDTVEIDTSGKFSLTLLPRASDFEISTFRSDF